MESHNWKHYFRWSLGLHAVILTALGLVLQHSIRPDLQTEPIRVKVEGFGSSRAPGAGTSGSSGGTAGMAEPGMTRTSALGAAGAVPKAREASLSSETGLQELLQAPVVSSAAAVSGESTVPSGTVSGNPDSNTDSGSTGMDSDGNGSNQGDGQETGPGTGTDSGGYGSADGGSQADLSQDAALQGYSRIYPRTARDAGEEGVAVVGVSVSAGGSVTRAWLEQSTGYDRLDRAALKAAYQWSFTPARNAAGDPIAGESRVTVRYQLDE